MLSLMFALLVLTAMTSAQIACPTPSPAANFTFELLEGRWYEVGNLQTEGGRLAQDGCICVTMDIGTFNRDTGDGEATYSCTDEVPEGDRSAITASLTEMNVPGRWQQRFFPGQEGTDWVAVLLTKDYGITWDCRATELSTNYCVHMVSRTPDGLDEATQQRLINLAESMGLNPLRTEYKRIRQEGCTY